MSLSSQEELALRVIVENYDVEKGVFFVKKYEEYEGYNFNYFLSLFKALERKGFIYDIVNMSPGTRGRITQEGFYTFMKRG
ncbi:MAG: hypothetical protein ACOX3W_02990 [Christensenellaceae bacterium]|jgi:DNA-binding IscR family transcriptional regulator